MTVHEILHAEVCISNKIKCLYTEFCSMWSYPGVEKLTQYV